MKSILFTLAAIFSIAVNSRADISSDSSFAEIEAAGYWVNYGKIQFGPLYLPANEVCVQDDRIVSIEPVTHCAEYSGGNAHNAPKCIREVTEVLSSRLRHVAAVPNNHSNGIVRFNQQTALEQDVTVCNGSGSTTGVCTIVFTKSFTIPKCLDQTTR